MRIVLGLMVTMLFVFGSGVALAQTDSPLAASPSPEADVSLSAEIQGELLPADGVRFGVETAWFRIRRAFTFQAERKAELDAERLERLEIKITACSELGDEECVAKLEQLITLAQDRAQRHLERKAEVLEKHRERFEELQARHEVRREELQSKLEERRGRLEELRETRREKLDEFREMRIERLEELGEQRLQRQEDAALQRDARQDLRQEQRELNREQLIELRSEAVKNRLDATRNRVQDYQEEYDSNQ